jgi:hypothetical protein
MSPERPQKPITLEEIISNAKEIMMRDGKHVPVLIMEADNKVVAGQIPDMPPTHGERVELMRFLGQAAAKSGKVNNLQQVFMVTEGWMSEPSVDGDELLPPSEDPKRKEVLIVSAIQMKERKKHLKVYEIARDQDEQVTGMEEFVPEDPQETSVEVPLLDAFVQGFQTGFQTKYN